MNLEQKVHVNLYLDSRRAKSNGKFPIKLRLFTKTPRMQKMYLTKFDATLKEFESVWNTVKPREEHKEFRKSLQAIIVRAENIVNKIQNFSIDEFEKKYFASNGSSIDVFWHYEQMINELIKKETISTASSYDLTVKSIKKFMLYQSKKEAKKLSFYDINVAWLESFEKYMTITMGKSQTTVGIYTRTLRAIFNKAILQKDIPQEIYPFGKNGYKIPMALKEKKALNSDLLNTLLNAEPKTKEQEKAKDFWFFSFACNGINIKDIAMLRNEKVHTDYFEFYRAKTIRTSKEKLKQIKVYLNDYSKGIISKYKTIDNNPKAFVFSIISDEHTPLEQHKKIQNFTKFINQHIKKLALDNGITDDISTYWARHSFATISIRKGAKIEFVSEALGHTDTKMTQHYFAGFDDQSKKEFAQSLMNF
jgi:integrase/recombinase XerD